VGVAVGVGGSRRGGRGGRGGGLQAAHIEI
jgi:hypothetical protein